MTSFRNNLCNVYGKVNKVRIHHNTHCSTALCSMNTFWSADLSNIYLRGGTARFVTND